MTWGMGRWQLAGSGQAGAAGVCPCVPINSLEVYLCLLWLLLGEEGAGGSVQLSWGGCKPWGAFGCWRPREWERGA